MTATPTTTASECVHLLTPTTCTYCVRTQRKRTPAPMSERARSDALYVPSGARPQDRRSPARSTARPWSGWRSSRPVVSPHYRRMGVRV